MEKLKKLSRLSKPLIGGLLLATFLLNSENTTTLSSIDIVNEITASSSIGVAEPNKDKTGWRIKEEDGKYYKRLYNYSTGAWIGDWIYIGDVP